MKYTLAVEQSENQDKLAYKMFIHSIGGNRFRRIILNELGLKFFENADGENYDVLRDNGINDIERYVGIVTIVKEEEMTELDIIDDDEDNLDFLENAEDIE